MRRYLPSTSCRHRILPFFGLSIEIMRLSAERVERGEKVKEKVVVVVVCVEETGELLMPNYATLSAGGVKEVVACVQKNQSN